MSTTEAGWHPDPLGRHEYRFWNGESWTLQVSNQGQVTNEAGEPDPPADHAQGPSTSVMPHSYSPVPYSPGGLPQATPAPHQQQHQQPQHGSQPPMPMAVHNQVMVVQQPKSMGIAFLLTFFFGPLGMLYSTVAGGIIMLFVSIFFAIFTLGLSIFITWPICIIWGMAACNSSSTTVVSSTSSGY